MNLRLQVTGDRGQQSSAESKVQSPKSKNHGARFTFQVSRLTPPLSLYPLSFSLQPTAYSLLPPLLASISLLCLCLISCGHKTPVRPPEWVAPEAIGDLALEVDNKNNVVELKWGRPQEYVDGSDMDDLGGFVVLRATEGEKGQVSGFTQVANIAVTDRDRFRKAKKFSYTDTQLTAGVLYRYRVQALTLDGYTSAPSNTVEIVWKDRPAEVGTPLQVPAKR
jgi:hypothetical protein